MRSLKLVLVVWLACLSAAPLTWAQGDFYLKDGDRVVFYGDSITEQRLYTTYTETYVVTRFPQLPSCSSRLNLPESSPRNTPR